MNIAALRLQTEDVLQLSYTSGKIINFDDVTEPGFVRSCATSQWRNGCVKSLSVTTGNNVNGKCSQIC